MDLFSPAQGVGSGQVIDCLPNGQYRVMFKGRPAVALSQAGVLTVGQQLTLARTAAGLIVVAAGRPTAAKELTEVVIDG